MRVLRAAAPALAACALIAGCAAPRLGSPELAALTPSEQFAIEVRSVPDEILLAPHGGLSPAQQAALADLAERWRDAGEGPIVVHTGPGRAAHTGEAAAHALQEAGVPAGFVQLAHMEAPHDAPAVPVRVGYSRLVAVGPQCANMWGDLTRTAANRPQAGFGCAVTANMAAQIANPRDLVSPRPSYPADAVRRATVMDKYRKGQPTNSERSGDERGDVSQVK